MPKDNSSFFPKRKRIATSGGIRTCDILRARPTLYQLSHRGSSAGQAKSLNVIQGQRCLSPDKHTHVHCTFSRCLLASVQMVGAAYALKVFVYVAFVYK